MNDKYNKAVFDFFTADKDRFLMMGKIAEHTPKVKKELIQRFWERLKKKLETHFAAKNEDWTVCLSDNWDIPINKIAIYKNAWCSNDVKFPLICIAFESLYENNHPFLGILVDRDGYGYTGYYNVDEINLALRRTPTIMQLGEDNDDDFWPVWQYLIFHLKNFDNLANLLPVNAEKTMDFLIADAERYVTALDDFMKENDNLKAFKL